MNGQTNAELASGIASSVAPYASGNGKDVSEIVSQMLRGTTVEDVLEKFKEDQLAKEEAIKAKLRAASAAENKAKADMQEVLAMINEAELARKKAVQDAEIAHEKELAAIEEAKQKAYAATVVEMLGAIQPGLIEAIQGSTNAELANGSGQAVAPYAIAGGQDISTVVSQMLRGTTMEDILKNFKKN